MGNGDCKTFSRKYLNEAFLGWLMAGTVCRRLFRVVHAGYHNIVCREGTVVRPFVSKEIKFKRGMSSGQGAEGALLQDVVRSLGNFASTKLAEKWDNVGLLVEPSGSNRVKKIFLTNDLTQEVLNEAIDKSANMIISYHPPIFVPFKRLVLGNWKERIIIKAIENSIAIYSPHTCFDAIKGGVNDWLISCFGSGDVQPITQSFDFSMSQAKPNGCYKMNFVFSNVDDDGSSLIKALDSMKETLKVNSSLQSSSLSLEVYVLPSEAAVAKVYGLINESKEEVKQSELSKMDNLPLPGFGMGRIVQLIDAITIESAVDKVKKHLNIPYVRLALARKASKGKKIRSIAVCAGSGGSLLKGVSADLFVTGEMSHHEVLHATESGRSVILCEHSNTERGFLRTLVPLIHEWFNGEVKVKVSSADKDPLTIA